TRLGRPGSPNSCIAFARTKPLPTPSIFLSPPRGPAGKDITIQGFYFQPNQDIFIEVGGVVVATTRTNVEGRFTSRIFIPVSGEGTQEIRVVDASGNLATASFYVDFGFDSLRDELKRLSEEKPVQASEGTTLRLMENITQLKEDVAGRLKALDEGVKDASKLSSELEKRIESLELMAWLASSSAIAAVVLVASSLIILVRRTR
ncbi:MAG: hypothetical protein QW815_03840, partial [Nitrososphaerota archaeon]